MVPPMSTVLSDSVPGRFWKHTDRSSEDGCWPWLLKPDAHGYGQINIGNKQVTRAHRVSYLLNVGEIPEGDYVVMHKCDNRICVRPDHLRLGTRAENIADCRAKGRWHNHKKPKREPVGRKGPKPVDTAARFWPKVDTKGGDIEQCWLFTGGLWPTGYGRFFMPNNNSVRAYAHRIAYMLHYGQIPDGLVVMHTCDNPPCCNPHHLRLGTLADNNRDRSAKGRGRENRQWGAANPRAKLTAELVLRIRTLYSGGVSQDKIAAMFDVKQPQVSRLVRGVSWPDGPWPEDGGTA